MKVVFLISFVGGLLLAVRIMIQGVERPRELSPAGERSFRLSTPIVVAFALAFGLSGYLLVRGPATGVAAAIAIAVALGLVASFVAARLVTAWWKVTPEHDVDDERYVLQGHLARVVKAIGEGSDGEVAFELGAEQRVVRARGVDHVTMSAGTEVVIERIEDNVAYVESWHEVEKRL